MMANNDSNDTWWCMTTVYSKIISMICNGKFQWKRMDKQTKQHQHPTTTTNIQQQEEEQRQHPTTTTNIQQQKEQTTTSTTTTTRLHLFQILSHLDQGARYEPTSLVRNTSGTVFWRLNRGSKVSSWAIKKHRSIGVSDWWFKIQEIRHEG